MIEIDCNIGVTKSVSGTVHDTGIFVTYRTSKKDKALNIKFKIKIYATISATSTMIVYSLRPKFAAVLTTAV